MKSYQIRYIDNGKETIENFLAYGEGLAVQMWWNSLKPNHEHEFLSVELKK